jgi:cytoskeleton protein RodZ
MDEELVETDVPTVGERLRAAREEKGLSLEDIAAQTRIPQRHLESLETADWDKLPAPTYTTGFAKSYATAVGLDRIEIGEQLRAEMGGQRSPTTATEIFEPVDPARTMPKWLVFGTIAAVILLILIMSWLNRRSLDQPEQAATANAPVPASAPAPTPAPATAVAAQGPVVLTANAPVWLQVSEQGGAILFSGTLQPGQGFTVPATASAPVLKTGKPEALKITVGNAIAPPVGPPATTVDNVSLRPSDLLRTGQAAPPPVAVLVAPAPPPARRPRASPLRKAAPATAAPAPAPAPPPAATSPPTTNTGE